jgi:hypothetical protein
MEVDWSSSDKQTNGTEIHNKDIVKLAKVLECLHWYLAAFNRMNATVIEVFSIIISVLNDAYIS